MSNTMEDCRSGLSEQAHPSLATDNDCLTCRWEPDWVSSFSVCPFLKIKGVLRLGEDGGKKTVFFIPETAGRGNVKTFYCRKREEKKFL